MFQHAGFLASISGVVVCHPVTQSPSRQSTSNMSKWYNRWNDTGSADSVIENILIFLFT
jgi:hypothetical protein